METTTPLTKTEDILNVFTTESRFGQLMATKFRSRWHLGGTASSFELGDDVEGNAACRGKMACGHAACRGKMACGNPHNSGFKSKINAGEIEKMYVDKIGMIPSGHANVYELLEKSLQVFSK